MIEILHGPYMLYYHVVLGISYVLACKVAQDVHYHRQLIKKPLLLGVYTNTTILK